MFGSIKVLLRYKDKEVFAENIATIDQEIDQIARLRHYWDEFRETTYELDEVQTDYGRPVVRNTVRPQEFFNFHDALFDRPMTRVLPGLFVGIGLILTFVGLVAALVEARGVFVEGGDPTEALKNLLTVASAKFYSSIAGLGISIFMTLSFRLATSVVERQLDILCIAIEFRMTYANLENISFQNWQEQKKQTVQLEQFNTQVALSIGQYVEEALNKTMPTHLGEAVQPLVHQISELVENLKSSSEDAVSNMVKELSDNLATSTKGASEEVAVRLSGLSDTLGQMASLWQWRTTTTGQTKCHC